MIDDMADAATQLAEAFDRTWPAVLAVAQNSPDQARLLVELKGDPLALLAVTSWAGLLLRRLTRSIAHGAGMDPASPDAFVAVLEFVAGQLAADVHEIATLTLFTDGLTWPAD